MNALLDTSVLLWWLGEPSRIPGHLLQELKNEESLVWYSQVSLLEIQIKVGIEKLRLDFPVHELPSIADRSGLFEMPLSNEAIFTWAKLPPLHRDLFDRLLICEAIQHSLPLITSDATIARYPVRVIQV